jgi:hypothetical protein
VAPERNYFCSRALHVGVDARSNLAGFALIMLRIGFIDVAASLAQM